MGGNLDGRISESIFQLRSEEQSDTVKKDQEAAYQVMGAQAEGP